MSENAQMLAELSDDLLSQILYRACKPVPWPWAEVASVCKRLHALCRRRRVRGWYLEHSSIIRTRVDPYTTARPAPSAR